MRCMSPSAPAGLACSPEQYAAELQRQNEHAAVLINGLTKAALNWQPNGGASWSIGQCLEHLTATNTVYLAAMNEGIEAKKVPLPPSSGVFASKGWFSRYFIQSMEPPPKRKFRASRKVMPARSDHQGDLLLTGFLTAQQNIAEFVANFGDVDLGRIRFRNPFIRGVRFTVSTGLLLIGAHNRRHLWQAERVKKSAGFPAI
jgi:hypothetical protein